MLRCTPTRDHPRMRGVYWEGTIKPLWEAGSSPHARGLRADAMGAFIQQRIIPACAGFTSTPSPAATPRQDHPRMRGVYPVSRPHSSSRSGSSPHARGLPELGGEVAEVGRIIPACAGFTGVRLPAQPRLWDHPRMRGVYFGQKKLDVRSAGSSPHARGLLDANNQDVLNARIIPACAGFTLFIAGGIRWWRDHPRMRGVYALTVIQFLLAPGSSPHARGLLVQAGKRQRSRRIIPACAGFTR